MSDKRVLATGIKNVEHLAIIDDIVNDRFKAMPLDALMVYLVDVVSADALPFLAEQFDVKGFKGFGLAETEDDKRKVIKRAIELHRYKGTVYGLREAIKSIGLGQATIEERPAGFEGTYGARHAYTFRVLFNVASYPSYEAATLALLTKIINEYKNARSHLVEIAIVVEITEQVGDMQDDLFIKRDMTLEENYGFACANYDGAYNHDGTENYRCAEMLDFTCNIVPGIYQQEAQDYIDVSQINSCASVPFHRLVKDLKDAGLWNSLLYFYPFYFDDLAQPKEFQASIDLKRPGIGISNGQMIFSGTVDLNSEGILLPGTVTNPQNEPSGPHGSFDATGTDSANVLTRFENGYNNGTNKSNMLRMWSKNGQTDYQTELNFNYIGSPFFDMSTLMGDLIGGTTGGMTAPGGSFDDDVLWVHSKEDVQIGANDLKSLLYDNGDIYTNTTVAGYEKPQYGNSFITTEHRIGLLAALSPILTNGAGGSHAEITTLSDIVETFLNSIGRSTL